jgi:hypothetical protein
MNIFELQGQSFIVHEGRVYVELSPQDQAAHNSSRGPKKCSLCQTEGHQAKTCPNRASTS